MIRQGSQKRFNLNLLERINRELECRFRHQATSGIFPVYDEPSGACRSYLVSLTDQIVTMWCNGDQQRIRFAPNEEIFMEISQKYRIDQVDQLAGGAFFRPVQRFCDDRGWFCRRPLVRRLSFDYFPTIWASFPF